MHILLGAIIGCVVSVALTYVASRVIDRPLTWKDVAASAVAGIVGGALATATLGVGVATTARTVTAFAVGGATGSAGGQITDNVLHGKPVQEGVVKATVIGTAIGAATLGVGKGAGALGRSVGIVGRNGAAAASTGHAHGNPLAGAAAGLDDAIVPVWRYVKNALERDPLKKDSDEASHGSDLAGSVVAGPEEPPTSEGSAFGSWAAKLEPPAVQNRGAMGHLQVLGE